MFRSGPHRRPSRMNGFRHIKVGESVQKTARIEKSLALFLRLIEDYKINGVIHLAHWGCRWNYGRIKILKEAFQEKGIPFMGLDCDLVSSRNTNEAQIMNRIDTFLDIL